MVVAVQATAETRREFTGILRSFRRNGAAQGIVVVGSHRKPEAAIVPYELIEALQPQIDDLITAARLRQRLASDDGVRFSNAEVAAKFGITVD